MNVIALLPIGSAALIIAALVHDTRRQQKAAKAKEAAWQIERAKLPDAPVGISLSPLRGDAKWIDGAWVSNIEIARQAAVRAAGVARQPFLDKACHVIVRTAMVFLGLFLLLLSLGTLIGACFCGFLGGLFLLLLSFFAGMGCLSCMWVGFGFAKK